MEYTTLNSEEEMELDENSSAEAKEYVKYLTFWSDSLLFGVNAAYVTEIITNHSITLLPMVPNFIKGIINLRGQIIPILDMRLKMNKPDIEYGDKSCIIVLDYNSISLGILVESVSQVIDICEEEIQPPPVKHSLELVNGIVSTGESVILLFDCERLMNNA